MKFKKNVLPAVICFLVGAAVLFSIIRFTGSNALRSFVIPDYSQSRVCVSDENSQAQLVDLAYEIAGYIRNGDYDSLSKTVHPSLGIVFVQYSTVSFSSNKCFTASEVASFGTDSTEYVWGTEDGTGEPIKLTPADYFARYVYNRDYSVAPIIGINYMVNTGNALENVLDEFPNARFIDLSFPGSAELQDWSTLRLVFEEYEGSYMLSAVIHSEPTL